MKKSDLAEIVFYTSILALFIWALLKATGVINSPAWVEMIPYFSIVFAAGAAYQKFSRLENDVYKILESIKDIDKRVIKMESRWTLEPKPPKTSGSRLRLTKTRS